MQGNKRIWERFKFKNTEVKFNSGIIIQWIWEE